ncbi:MAG: 7TM-DISM domain-containing protein [Alphaproteobacteria bacterium]
MEIARVPSTQTTAPIYRFWLARGQRAILIALIALVVCAAVCAAVVAGASSPPRTLVLTNDTTQVAIGSDAEYYEDRSKQLSVGDVDKIDFNARFRQIVDPSASFGFSTAAVWLRFQVRNQSTKQDMFLLEVGHPSLDKVEVFVPQAAGDYAIKVAGDRVPASRREIRHRNILIPLHLPRGSETTIYVRAEGQEIIRVPLALVTPEALAARDRNEQMILGVMLGIIVIMALYVLTLFFSVRDASLLYLAGFIVSYGAIHFWATGLAYELLWPEWTAIMNIGAVAATDLAIFGGLAFALRALRMHETMPRLCLVMRVTAFAALLMIPLSVVANAVAFRASYLLGFVAMIELLAAGIIAWRRRERDALLFLFAWLVPIASLVLTLLSYLGELGDLIVSATDRLASTVGAVVLLSLYVAQRIRHNREAREAALKRSEERYTLAMDGAREGLWDWDMIAGKAYFSGRMLSELGLERIGRAMMSSPRKYTAAIHPDDRHHYYRTMKAHIDGKSPYFECEYRIVGRDGTVRWVLDRAVAMRDENGRAYRMAGSVGNITRLKDTENALREAKNQAEAANQAKSDFLAHMSHELRTPLNAVIGFAEMMETETLGPMGNVRYRDYVRDIRTSGEHLLELINDILDISKVEAGKYQLNEREFDLHELVADALHIVTARAQKAGVVLSDVVVDGLPNLRADKRAIKQVMLNLLSNAIKFTPAGGRVTVKTGVDSKNGIVLSVADTGVGIRAEDIPKILKPFEQISTPLVRQQEGTGLGLPLAKSFVELHGAVLEIRSEEGAGTMMVVRFPPSRSVVKKPPRAVPKAEPPPRPREPVPMPAALAEPLGAPEVPAAALPASLAASPLPVSAPAAAQPAPPPAPAEPAPLPAAAAHAADQTAPVVAAIMGNKVIKMGVNDPGQQAPSDGKKSTGQSGAGE